MPSTQEMANAPMVQILGAQGRAYGVEVTVARGWMGPPGGAPRASGATTHKVHPDKPGDHKEVSRS